MNSFLSAFVAIAKEHQRSPNAIAREAQSYYKHDQSSSNNHDNVNTSDNNKRLIVVVVAAAAAVVVVVVAAVVNVPTISIEIIVIIIGVAPLGVGLPAAGWEDALDRPPGRLAGRQREIDR